MDAAHGAFLRDAMHTVADPKSHGSDEAAQGLPRVSVIVTCFNYAKYIRDALDSVAAQTYPHWECVIVDDCSTDNSIDVIERWMSETGSDRFRLLKGTVNQGQLASMARGMNATSGELVAFLDADDFWLPTFLSRHVEVHRNPLHTASASCSDMLQIDADGRFLSGNMKPIIVLPETTSPKNAVQVRSDAVPSLHTETSRWVMPGVKGIRYVKPGATEWVWTATSAMVFRRRAVEFAMPRNPETVGICADHYLIHICSYFEGSVLMDEALGAYRRHRSNSFSYLPVLGIGARLSPHNSQDKLDESSRAMLQHLLDRHVVFSATFGAPQTKKLIHILATQMTKRGAPLREPRLGPILGMRWYYLARLELQLTDLRRRIAKAFQSKWQFKGMARDAS